MRCCRCPSDSVEPMSSQQGGTTSSGTSPAEDIVEPDSDAVSDTAAPAQPPAGPVEEENDDSARSDAQIAAAGGRVLGEAEIAAVVDRSRVRRAPRYKRFAVQVGSASGRERVARV